MEWLGRVCEWKGREGKAKYGVHWEFCNREERNSMYSNIEIVFHPHTTNPTPEK